MKRSDILLIIGILVLAAGLYGLFSFSEPGGLVEIYLDGTLERVVPLPAQEEELLIETRGGWNLLRLTPEGVCIAQASCAGQDCVHTGELRRAGQTAACLPNGLLVRLRADKPDAEVDAVAG